MGHHGRLHEGEAGQVSWQRHSTSSELGRTTNETTHGTPWHAPHAPRYEDARNASWHANASWHGTTWDATRHGTSTWHDGRTSSPWYDGSSRYEDADATRRTTRHVQTTNVEMIRLCLEMNINVSIICNLLL